MVPEVNPRSSRRQDLALFYCMCEKHAQKRDGRVQTEHMGKERQGDTRGDTSRGATLQEGTSST